jgi:hypothetical protein
MVQTKGQKFMNAEDTMSTQKGQDQGESSQPSKRRIESESARPWTQIQEGQWVTQTSTKELGST